MDMKSVQIATRLLRHAVRTFPGFFISLLELERRRRTMTRFARLLDARLTLVERGLLAGAAREKFATKPARSTAYELAAYCGLVELRQLYRLAARVARHYTMQPDVPGNALNALYRTHTIPKRCGGVRTITVPNPHLKRLQRSILDQLLARVPLHSAATGFRPGCSIVSNATPHVGQRLVVNVDIAACFESTKYPQLLRACRIAGAGALSPRAIRLLAEICSYQGALPTGAPTSPALANIVLTTADHAIATAAARAGIRYTRYADDLTFSGNADIHRLLPFVGRVLNALGFTIAPHKVNFYRRGGRQLVTGLVVNDCVNVPRYVRRRLRAAVHRASHDDRAVWNGAPASRSTLLGVLAFVGATQPQEAARLRAKLLGTSP